MPKSPTAKNPLDSYRAAVTADPNRAEAHSNLGWGHYGAGQFAEAVQEFQAALHLDPNWVDALYGLGMAHKALGAKLDAVSAFNQVATLARQVEDVDRGRMLVRLAHGHINELNTGDWNLEAELRHKKSAA